MHTYDGLRWSTENVLCNCHHTTISNHRATSYDCVRDRTMLLTAASDLIRTNRTLSFGIVRRRAMSCDGHMMFVRRRTKIYEVLMHV